MSSNKSVKHSIEFSDRSRVTVGVYCAVYWLIAAIPAIIVDGVRRGFHYSAILKPQRLARCIIRATIPKSTMLSICKCSWNSLVRTFKSFCFFALLRSSLSGCCAKELCYWLMLYLLASEVGLNLDLQMTLTLYCKHCQTPSVGHIHISTCSCFFCLSAIFIICKVAHTRIYRKPKEINNIANKNNKQTVNYENERLQLDQMYTKSCGTWMYC